MLGLLRVSRSEILKRYGPFLEQLLVHALLQCHQLGVSLSPRCLALPTEHGVYLASELRRLEVFKVQPGICKLLKEGVRAGVEHWVRAPFGSV